MGKIPWRRKWQFTPVFLPGKFHGQRSLVGYGPWGHEELDRTEHMHTHIGNIYRLSNREGPRDKEMYHIENKAS